VVYFQTELIAKTQNTNQSFYRTSLFSWF